MADDSFGEDWTAAPVATERPRLTDEQREAIKADLWRLGITQDPFALDPIARQKWLSSSKNVAIAVYAAIKHETRNTHKITQSFAQWCREMDLPHA